MSSEFLPPSVQVFLKWAGVNIKGTLDVGLTKDTCLQDSQLFIYLLLSAYF
jgi:hypothetical protein